MKYLEVAMAYLMKEFVLEIVKEEQKKMVLFTLKPQNSLI